MPSAGIPDEEYQRYNKERVAYFDKCERYLRAATEMQNRMARTLRFTVAISNAGSAPADDVDVRLFFPDGFVLCAEDDLPAPPREPKRPVKPRNQMEMITANMALPNFRMPEMHMPDLGPISSFRLRKTNSYEVSDHFARIKHGQTEELRELFLTFDSHESSTSFHCKYEVSVGKPRAHSRRSTRLPVIICRFGGRFLPLDDKMKGPIEHVGQVSASCLIRSTRC